MLPCNRADQNRRKGNVQSKLGQSCGYNSCHKFLKNIVMLTDAGPATIYGHLETHSFLNIAILLKTNAIRTLKLEALR